MRSGIRSYPPVTRGLATQVGFIRLAPPRCPKSGQPDFGWSIFFVKTFCERDGSHRYSGLPELRILMRRKSGIPDFAVSSPAMMTAVIRCQR